MTDWPDRKDILDRVIGTLESFDWEEIERLCRTGDNNLLARLNRAAVPFPPAEGNALLKALRRKRQFALMGVLADAFIRAGAPAEDDTLRKLYGQALIDQGQLVPAETVLRGLLDRRETSDRERDEALGLMGRIYKQEYVDAAEPSNPRQQQNLAKAASFYCEAYRRNRGKNIWQGINYVALLARARKDGLTLDPPCGSESVVLAEVEAELKRRTEEEGELYYWDRAIELEAAVARGEAERVEDALHWYLRDERADAFEFASTLRQLREVWQLRSDTPPDDAVVNGLKAAVLKRGGEGVEVRSTDIRGLLQKNFSGDKDLPLKWWQTGLRRCTAIARIEAPSGRHVGTGFLVNRSDFHLDHIADPVLLTNWHVVSEGGEDPLSIPPDDAIAHFESCDEQGGAFRLKAVVAGNRRLDASFVSLEPVSPDLSTCPLRVPPAAFVATERQRLYVIGYPGGRGLSFSLHDSRWLDSDGTRFHYRTPTEAGNSGSPVFDEDNWMLVGLHHAGGKDMPRLNGQAGVYDANEAFSIVAIQNALATSLKS